MSYKLSSRSQKHLSGVNPKLVSIVERALQLTNVDFGIPETGGRRSISQQKALYDAGLSKLDGITRRSQHQTGNAVDVFAYVDGKATWDTGDLAEVAAAMLQAANEMCIEIKWGGSWKSFKDYPHFEIAQ